MTMLPTNLDQYTEKSLTNRFFKHRDVEALLQKLDKRIFSIEPVGKSFQDRSINLVKAGTGKIKVFLWSQMHGDEATATMALFDLFNFLSGDGELKRMILSNCTLFILPMVNPDGAEAFTRRNAQGIDINRDFNRQQSPEGRLLRRLRDEIKPEFGFNLHDQGNVWSAGNTGNPAAISLLAPPFDPAMSVNEVRTKAIQVVSCINKKLQTVIPDHVGRWTDEYEARAYGDNFQATSTSTILIESGSLKNDPEKQQVRRLTFISILAGLEAIATKSYSKENADDYFLIPDNEKRHFDILLRNCSIGAGDNNYIADIGLVGELQLLEGAPAYSYLVEDIGDLTGFYGYAELDASGYSLICSQPLICGNPADLILSDGKDQVLSIENGRLTNNNL